MKEEAVCSGADNRIDTLRADLSKDRMVFGPKRVLCRIICSSIIDRIRIRIIVFLHWARLCLHNTQGGRALRLEKKGGPRVAAK